MQGVRPDDDRRLARRHELERLAGRGRGQRAGQQLDGDRRVLEQRRQRPVVLPGEQVRRGEERALQPGPRRRRERVGRDGRLAATRRRPGGAGASASAGRGRPGCRGSPRPGPSSARPRGPSFRAERALERGPKLGVVGVGARRPAGPRPAPAAAAARPSPAGARAARRTRAAAAPRRGPRTSPGSGPPRAPAPIADDLLALARSAAAGTPGTPCPARSSASRIAIRSRFAVSPAVSR